MADVNGRPFLSYILDYLAKSGIKDAVLSVGYKHEIITGYFKDAYGSMNIKYAVEDRPLGTGGAIKLALGTAGVADGGTVLVVNGDTFSGFNLKEMAEFHAGAGSAVTIGRKNGPGAGRDGGGKL